jgi:hypothetical protein
MGLLTRQQYHLVQLMKLLTYGLLCSQKLAFGLKSSLRVKKLDVHVVLIFELEGMFLGK